MDTEKIILTTVEEACSDFRNLINSVTHEREELIEDIQKWLVVCSSMDVIDDTELAIKAYEKLGCKIDQGKAYLAIYGLLQAMYVQQDAVFNIRKTLDTPRFNDQEEKNLLYIREIRNDTVGHPTKRSQKDIKHRANFLHRYDMSLTRFTLQKSHFEREIGDEFVEIEPLELIENQREIITKFLNFLISSLKDRVNKHRETFMDKKLANCFPHTYRYHISKIYEAREPDKFTFAAINFKTVVGYIEDFKQGIKERKLEKGLMGLECTLDELKRPLQVLSEYFSSKRTLEEGDVDIYVYYLNGKVTELVEMAKEIDKEFSQKM